MKSFHIAVVMILLCLGGLSVKASETPAVTLSEPQAKAIRAFLAQAEEEGLNPQDYSLTKAADETVLYQMALKYIRDLKAGRKAPKAIDPELFIYPDNIDAAALLNGCLGEKKTLPCLENLTPQYPEYIKLKALLKTYREIDERGGWPVVPEGETLRPNMQDPRVPVLVKRLKIGGYLENYAAQDEIYSEPVVKAVHVFQVLHGIDNDGVLGVRTLKALNVPAKQRIQQIILNLERWRWMPEKRASRYIEVNIAGYTLKAVDGGHEAFEMPVIVGKPYHRTPVMVSTIENIIFHPYWHVPRSIATRSLLPQFQKDQAYVMQQGFEVFSREGQLMSDPQRLNWGQYSENHFPLTLRQKPGSKNALGHVRFSLVNDQSIYLHGTSDQDLFLKTDRAKSSGCIRVERPLDLAQFVLEGTEDWPPSKIRTTYYEGIDKPDIKPLTAPLNEALPVYLQYWTVWVDSAGRTHFREDLYGRDKRLAHALGEKS